MGLQRGSNSAGVNGILDITGAGKQFHVLAETFDKNGNISRKARIGRGNAGYEISRPLFEVTTIVVRGKNNPDGWPEPNSLRNANGTITLTYHTVSGTPYQASYPVQVDSSNFNYNDKTKDNWAHAIAFRVTGAATWSGWPSSQPSPTAPSYVDLELYDGTSKALDPNDLATQAQRRTDAVNIADNDTAEATKLAAMAAAAVTPLTGLKLRGINFTRTDKLGGDVVEDWQKNDTVDDYEYPATYIITDPKHLQSVASGGTIDGTPSTPSGFTLRASKTVTVRTGHTFTTREFGLRTTAEDIEFPGTKTEVDPFDLDTTGVETTVHDTDTPPSDPTPPTHTKIVNKWTVELTSAGTAQSQTVWNFAPQSSVDKIEQGESRTTTDANGLESAARLTAVDGTPSTPSGLVVRLTTTRDLSDWHTATSVEYGTRDTVDDIEMPGTVATADPLELDSKARAAEVYTTLDGAPSSPAAPLAELQLVATETEELNRTKSVIRSIYDTLNSEEKRTFPKTSTTDDANNISDEAMRAEFWNTGDTPPALPTDAPTNNVKLLFFVDTPETAGKRLRVWFYGPANSRDKKVLPNYETVADASDLESTAIRACLDGESISDPSGYVIRLTKTIPLSFSLGTNRTLTIKVYGLRTTAEDIEMPGTKTKADPLEIESAGTHAEVYTTASGVPADPTPPLTELQVVATETEELNQTKSVKRTTFGVLNSEEKETYPKISTTDDANNIEDEAIRAEVWDVGDTPPATPTDAPSNNVKLVEFVDYPITPFKNVRVWRYGPKNSRDKAVLPHYETTADASSLEATAVRAGLDGETITDPSGYTLRLTKTIPLTDSLGTNRTLTIKIYGLRTTAADITMPGTWTKIDPSGLETFGRETQVYTTASGVPSDPTPPTGTQITASRIEVLNDLKSKKEWEYEVNSSVQKINYSRSKSARSPLDPWTDVVHHVQDDSSSDLTSLATTLFAVYQSDPNLVRLEVQRLTPAKIGVTWYYSDPGIMVIGRTFAPQRISPFRINGTTPQVYIAAIEDIDGTDKWMLHRSQTLVTTPVREFVIRRTLSGTTIPDQEAHVGKVNSTTFLGIGAGKVMYMGAEYRTRYDASGTRSFEMEYRFRADANGFFNYVGVCDEWFVTSASASVGWVDASTFTGLIAVTTPTGADFAGIFLV